jgi:protein-S-isoprenylcysteine O-methyltransferase Ste14
VNINAKKRTKRKKKRRMKIQKNPVIGVILGIGFMVLGILQIVYPELAGATTPRGVSIAKLTGLLLFIAGLAQVCYIEYKRRVVC